MSYQTVNGVKVWGEPLLNAVDQMANCAKSDRMHDCALMADHHLGYAVPIGGVIAYENAVSPSGVGYDIACGNMAVRLGLQYGDIKDKLPSIMDSIFREVSFGVGRVNNAPIDHEVFDLHQDVWGALEPGIKDTARAQLGTVGSGNHYVDLFKDANGFIWIGVHFGSRGLGHKIATHFIRAGGGKDGINVDPVLLDIGSDLGDQYWAAMQLAGAYAYAGREQVCAQVQKILGAEVHDTVHNHHNFAWQEVAQDGTPVCVVRKGATPAFPGQRSFIGGTMADPAVIIRGVDSQESKDAMYSTVHGAGRSMSRTEAAGKFKGWGKKRVRKTEGKITQEMMDDRVNAAGVELRGAGVDESPHCYKVLSDVLVAQGNTIYIETVLYPIGVAMAGNEIVDPYKD